ncbi:MAG: hypothetical protein K2X38_25150 [Gemmataceae bacterium]|nr:hypothetical protein [Gemmataceae bacterium]
MRFEGSLLLARSPSDLWPRLSDARWLIQRVPDRASESLLAEDHAKAVIRPGLAFVRGAIDVEIRRTKADTHSDLEFAATSRGIGSSAELSATLHLADEESSTRVDWSVTITALGGLLRAVPSGLIRAAAQKAIDDVLANLQRDA